MSSRSCSSRMTTREKDRLGVDKYVLMSHAWYDPDIERSVSLGFGLHVSCTNICYWFLELVFL